MTTIETAQSGEFAAGVEASPLSDLPLGTRCRIVAVDEDSESLLRLMEMGLIPGAEAVLERSAPFNTPYSLRLTGCTLAVRREDARRILAIPLPDPSPES